jgi:chemotaxis signal transduction protein
MVDEATHDILRQRAEQLARPIQTTPTLDRRLVRFQRTAQFALPVEVVRDVRPLTAMEAIPHGPRWIVGLVAWRGGPVPAIDLAEVFETAANDPARQIVIAASPRGDIALVADDVAGVVACDSNSVQAIPRGVPEHAARLVTGYLPSIGLFLDVDALVEGLAAGSGAGDALR